MHPAGESQGEHARAYAPVNDGGRARGRTTDGKYSTLLRRHNGGAGTQRNVRMRPDLDNNRSALHVAENRNYSSRAKHVALRLFDVREITQEGKISIHYVSTELNM